MFHGGPKNSKFINTDLITRLLLRILIYPGVQDFSAPFCSLSSELLVRFLFGRFALVSLHPRPPRRPITPPRPMDNPEKHDELFLIRVAI